MQRRHVSCLEKRDGRCGREHPTPDRRRPAARGTITGGAPGQQAIAEDQKSGRGLVKKDEHAVGQVVQRRLEADLAARARLDPSPVQHPIHNRRGAVRGAERPPPCGLELPERCAPALETGPMPGRQRRRFVEKEQLGVAARRHDRAPATPEAELATDPAAMPPARRTQRSAGVVQDTAVAHERAARRVGDDLTRGRHPVLQRHGRG
jgi:hypothetical protein